MKTHRPSAAIHAIDDKIRRLSREAIAEGFTHIKLKVGRNVEELDLWWLCGARIADSRAESEERMLTLTAALINAHGQVTLGGKLIPDDILDDAQYLIDHYDFNAHVKHGPQVADADVNGQLLRSLPRLREYASRRYVIGGTPSDCVDQIRAAGEAGVRQFWWTVSFPDKMPFVRAFASEVIPELRWSRAGAPELTREATHQFRLCT